MAYHDAGPDGRLAAVRPGGPRPAPLRRPARARLIRARRHEDDTLAVPSEPDTISPDVDQRVTAISDGFEPTRIAEALRAGRESILQRWLEVTARQPFHRERPDGAVADHIPALFDAIVDLLERAGQSHGAGDAPADDDAIAAAATTHAQVRFEQGLGPVAVVTEFRLLRLEVSRALGRLLDDEVPASDVVSGLALVSDALDGATTIGLTALSTRIETLRESFLATTLHDVRQPITLVNGSLHLSHRWLTAPEPDVDRVRETVADALVATTELMAMIDTMSDASRVSMGELEADREPASLEGVVRTSLAAFGEDARRRVRLQVPPSGHLIGLWDVGLMHRLVANLLGNALKYSAPAGAVDVTLSETPTGTARLVIADQGMGMTSEELSSVFERFVRADRVRREGIPGLGLGLYACRGIVTAHDGRISIDSAGPGKGTTVVVELPLLSEDSLDD